MSTLPRTIAAVQAGLRSGEFSAVELVKSFLSQIDATDKKLGAWLRTRSEVTDEAAAVDARLAAGAKLRPLEGVPIAIKDNLNIKGERTTAAAKILETYQAVFTATAVQRLRDQGGLCLGKTNLDEFAMGASTENSAYQVTRNPWNIDMVPGGSSGGSAVAVAAGQAIVALGSDTGGSVRQPAAFCNVVGMKPTYGRVSRYGLIALASSLDQIGPFAQTVEDAALVYQTMAGQDDNDATCRPAPVDEVMADLAKPIKDMKIGLPKEFFGDGVDQAVIKAIEQAIEVYKKLGAKIVEVSVPHAPQALPTYYIIQPAEASSNLARYDGIRYGLSVRDGKDLNSIYRRTRATGFGAEVKRRIMLGTFALSSGYADEYYHQAKHIQNMLRAEFAQVFKQVDILLSPTSPTVAFPIGARTQDPLSMYMADLLTVPANLAGIPAMSVPAGLVNDLPVGLQLMAKNWDEATMFRVGYAFQQATDWHTKIAPVAG